MGAWTAIPAQNRLLGPDGEVVELEYKVMEVLVALTERPGAVVSREALMAAVWPDTVVGPDLLTRAVSVLRKAFGDDPLQPGYIETIRKRGYRLLARVEPLAQAGSEPVASSTPRSPASSAVKVGLGVVGVILAVAVGWELTAQDRSPDPSPARVLTSLPGRELYPALSPDGGEVAFSWQGADGDNWDLYVQKVGAESPLRRTTAPAADVYPTWSPDGTHLAFQRLTDSTCTLFVIPALSGAERPVGTCLPPRSEPPDVSHKMAWSPDGRWLALVGAAEGVPPVPAIYLLDLDTQTRRRLTRPGRSADVAPTFSPDGAWVTFTRIRSWTQSTVYRVPVAGGTPEPLTDGTDLVLGHTWLPDGDGLIVASDRDGLFKLWQWPLGAGAPMRLPVTGRYQNAPAQAGGRLVYEDWQFDANLWRLSLTDTLAAPVRLVASTLWEGDPAFSPDGASIAFVSSRSGSPEIWRSAADGTGLTQVTHFGDATVGGPAWSPDGTTLLFSAQRGSWEQLYRLPAAGGVSELVTHAEANHAYPTWGPKQQWIYYAANVDGEWGLWKRHTETGETALLTRGFHLRARATPDGETLYFTQRRRDGLWRMSTGGGDPVLVLPDWPSSDWGNWHLVGGMLYLVERMPDGPVWLTRYDPGSGRTTRVRRLPEAPPAQQQGLVVGPDHSELLLLRYDQMESDLMWVEW